LGKTCNLDTFRLKALKEGERWNFIRSRERPANEQVCQDASHPAEVVSLPKYLPERRMRRVGWPRGWQVL
jgi:hypothetical protein